jgi:hypothetical protein
VAFKLLEQHLVVVKGSVTELRDLNLLIDTGTIPSVLDTRSDVCPTSPWMPSTSKTPSQPASPRRQAEC